MRLAVLRSALFPAALALASLAAGCAPESTWDCPPDAVPTAQSGRVLAGYDDRYQPRPRCPLESVPARAVSLPGAPERPWAGAPRSRPVPVGSVPDAVVPLPGPGPTPVPGGPGAPAERRLAPGDLVDVEVASHPEFSGQWWVRADGRLAVPEGGAFGPELLSTEDFATSVGRVAELSPEEAARSIGRALQAYVVKPPAVKVTVAGRRED